MSRSSRSAVDAHVCPSTSEADPGALAGALLRHARGSGYAIPLYVLPETGRAGRFEPETGRTWWIAPEREPPVYRCGKIIVTSRHPGSAGKRGGGAALFVGLCMHKGLEPRGAESLSAARWEHAWIMTVQPHWVWEDFLREMAAGYIDPLAAKAEEIGECPLTVLLEVYDPDGNIGPEAVTFAWSRGEIVPLPSPHRRTRSHLRDFASAGTLVALAQRLRYAPQSAGLWIDLALGFSLWVNRAGPGTVPWDEHRIWASACRPWSLWLR